MMMMMGRKKKLVEFTYSTHEIQPYPTGFEYSKIAIWILPADCLGQGVIGEMVLVNTFTEGLVIRDILIALTSVELVCHYCSRRRGEEESFGQEHCRCRCRCKRERE